MSVPVSRIELELPEGWLEIDPREEDLVEAVQSALDVPPENEALLVELVAPLAIRLRRLAVQGDVVLAGFFSQLVPIEGEEPLVISAQVLLALSPPVGDLERLQDAVAGEGVEVRPVDLPAGSGVLVSGTIEVDSPGWAGPTEAVLRRYFVPVPGMSRVAALSFLTPNVDLADDFAEVFDAVAGTLTFR